MANLSSSFESERTIRDGVENISDGNLSTGIDNTLTLIPSNVGAREKAFSNGFSYHYERKHKDTVYWKCSR